MSIALVNHGCPKNLVDFEWMMTALSQAGFDVSLDVDSADIVIVNTCAFIHDAEKESVKSILEILQAGKKVIVTGCLAQKYKDELKKSIPELSGMLGISEFNKIVDVVKKVLNSDEYTSQVSDKPCFNFPDINNRLITTVGASAYLKISDGCNCSCGYCIIPKLRGKQVSRSMEDIIAEAKYLVSLGIVEIILIAQDTTAYGIDNYEKLMLPELLRELNKIEGIRWIRVMYAYPTGITDDLLLAFNECDKVVKYLDIPLQHYDKSILESMKRPVFDYDNLINRIRKSVPNIALRTTFIVGYPGETEEQFEGLKKFVERTKFERMGVFKFCREKGTYAYSLKNQIPAKLKSSRYKEIMSLQKSISKNIYKSYVGDTIKCIAEVLCDDGTIILRSEYDAPEIDGILYSNYNDGVGHEVVPGDIVNVKVTGASEYDLQGIITEIL